ncbi:MAG: class I SAM-dependent methyltransferase [Actinomycetota bacterium]
MSSETTDHVRKNREHWEREATEYQRRNRSQLNRWDRLGWGVFDASEDEINALGDVDGLRALELGCGAGQFGIRVAMRGAALTGLDFSMAQLRHAPANFEETGVRFPLVQGNGERLPFRDEEFDLVFCDHGVMGFADPALTVPEVARVLRRGGRFVFNGTTPWIWVAWGDQEEELPATREMRMDYFEMRSVEQEDPSWRTTEFQLPYGEWIRLFRSSSLAIEDLIELRPSADATSTYDDYAPVEWARAFPAEQIWKVRKE